MLHNYDSQVRSVFYTTGFFQSHQQCIEEKRVLRPFHRSCVKTNKISKSEGIRKVEYAYHF